MNLRELRIHQLLKNADLPASQFNTFFLFAVQDGKGMPIFMQQNFNDGVDFLNSPF